MFTNTKFNRNLQKAYTFFMVDGNTTIVPIVFDRERKEAYLHTPNRAGNVDVVKCDLRDFIFNPITFIPGFKAVTLRETPQFPIIPMSTQKASGIFGKVQEETSKFLMNVTDELKQLFPDMCIAVAT